MSLDPRLLSGFGPPGSMQHRKMPLWSSHILQWCESGFTCVWGLALATNAVEWSPRILFAQRWKKNKNKCSLKDGCEVWVSKLVCCCGLSPVLCRYPYFCYWYFPLPHKIACLLARLLGRSLFVHGLGVLLVSRACLHWGLVFLLACWLFGCVCKNIVCVHACTFMLWHMLPLWSFLFVLARALFAHVWLCVLICWRVCVILCSYFVTMICLLGCVVVLLGCALGDAWCCDRVRRSVLWSTHPTGELLNGMKPNQKTNHFPGSQNLGRKDQSMPQHACSFAYTL